MPGYVEVDLHKFQHPSPSHLEDSPYQQNILQYGTKIQLMDPVDTSPPLLWESCTIIQEVTKHNGFPQNSSFLHLRS